MGNYMRLFATREEALAHAVEQNVEADALAFVPVYGPRSANVTHGYADAATRRTSMASIRANADGNEREDLDDAYGPMFGLPVTVVISRDGKICGKHVGLAGKDAFEREIKSLL